MASKLFMEGKQLTGAVANALKINCKDKDGNKSTVQSELNKLYEDNQNENLIAQDGTPFRFGKNDNGEYGYIIADSEGADTVIPFKSGGCVTTKVTFTKANEIKKINISEIFPNYKNITKDNIFVQINTTNYVHTAGSNGTFSRYNGIPKLTSYNSETGDISLHSGQLGFGYTGMGQHYEYATSMTIIISS